MFYSRANAACQIPIRSPVVISFVALGESFHLSKAHLSHHNKNVFIMLYEITYKIILKLLGHRKHYMLVAKISHLKICHVSAIHVAFSITIFSKDIAS